MTKKHYVAIADILKSEATRPHEGSEYARGYKACLHVIGVSLARYFQTENKAFDYDRFLAACDTARHTWKAQQERLHIGFGSRRLR